METEKMSGGSWRIIRRVILVIFDIFAVNISYYGALVIRFYVSGAFHVSTTKYPECSLNLHHGTRFVVSWFLRSLNSMMAYGDMQD